MWSLNYYSNEFIISQVPDVCVLKRTPGMEEFLVIASDGLWGVMSVEEVVKFVHGYDKDCNLEGLSYRYVDMSQHTRGKK